MKSMYVENMTTQICVATDTKASTLKRLPRNRLFEGRSLTASGDVASDAIAQLQVERADRIDWARNAAFAFFSGAYLGVGQHFVYNVAFTRLFGSQTNVATALRKVAADSFGHVPLLYLPLYYLDSKPSR